MASPRKLSAYGKVLNSASPQAPISVQWQLGLSCYATAWMMFRKPRRSMCRTRIVSYMVIKRRLRSVPPS